MDCRYCQNETTNMVTHVVGFHPITLLERFALNAICDTPTKETKTNG